ncbi:MAG: hypothetical protein DRP01_04505 [Archaeoglobales archaeon]|nr:MAG: hypothetical protein DRP01_04505 [Archaeoglobales archaeon]
MYASKSTIEFNIPKIITKVIKSIYHTSLQKLKLDPSLKPNRFRFLILFSLFIISDFSIFSISGKSISRTLIMNTLEFGSLTITILFIQFLYTDIVNSKDGGLSVIQLQKVGNIVK